jgi:hypothetical protein
MTSHSRLRYLVPLFITGTLTTLTLSSCKRNPSFEPEQAAVCKEDAKGKEVTVRGYIATGGVTICSSTCGLRLRANREDQYPSIGAIVAIGEGTNKMRPLPEKFSPRALEITASDGSELGHLDAVTVRGELTTAVRTPEGDIMCDIKVSAISPAK